jgi:uncharacterized peroxidase-related enzyme
MAWIRTVSVEDAEGALEQQYDAAVKRAGRVYGIVRAMSLAPNVLRASMAMYREIMFGEGGLSRRRREMLAVVTSAANDCHY